MDMSKTMKVDRMAGVNICLINKTQTFENLTMERKASHSVGRIEKILTQ